MLFLIVANARINPVQAVGLVGGAVLGAYDSVDVAINFACQGHLTLGLGIIGVCADKNLIVGVRDSLYGVVKHTAYNVRLIPAGNHYCNRLFWCGKEL